jgi:hypothetical protein
MGRGIPHFFEEGTRLEPLAEIADPYREELRTLTANGKWGAACFGWTREAKRRVKRMHQKPSPEVAELVEVTE